MKNMAFFRVSNIVDYQLTYDIIGVGLSREMLGDARGSARNRLVPRTCPATALRLSNLLDGRCSKNDSFSPCVRARWVEMGALEGRYSRERRRSSSLLV